jgi:hypothetical protein
MTAIAVPPLSEGPGLNTRRSTAEVSSYGWQAVGLASLLVWSVFEQVAGGNAFLPLFLAALWFATERLIGIPLEWAARRLALLSTYGLLGVFAQTVMVPHQPTHFLYDDEPFYDQVGRFVAMHLPPPVAQDNKWGYIVGWVYRWFGAAPIHMRGLPAVAGVLLVGLLAQIASELMDTASSRRLYWLAGFSPALLVWVIGGIRDIIIGLGVALVVSILLTPVARIRRAALGVVLLLALRNFMLLLPLAVIVLGLLQTSLRRRRPLTGLIVLSGVALGVFRWGISIGRDLFHEQIGENTGQFVSNRVNESVSAIAPLQSLVERWQLFGLIPGLILAVFTPVWFAVGAPGTPGALMTAFGALGWWLLLPAILVGTLNAFGSTRMTTVVMWGGFALLAAAGTLLTVFQDPARMRVTGLGAFFLLAAWGIYVSPATVRRWTIRWAIVNLALLVFYVGLKSGMVHAVRALV